LAVERFPISLQPALGSLQELKSEKFREEEMRRILQTDEYQSVWGTNPVDQSNFPNPFDASYPRNFPSAEVFEVMMLWAARTNIPIIGLDLPTSERAKELGSNITYRNGSGKPDR
jgi:hypothetical protein